MINKTERKSSYPARARSTHRPAVTPSPGLAEERPSRQERNRLSAKKSREEKQRKYKALEVENRALEESLHEINQATAEFLLNHELPPVDEDELLEHLLEITHSSEENPVATVTPSPGITPALPQVEQPYPGTFFASISDAPHTGAPKDIKRKADVSTEEHTEEPEKKQKSPRNREEMLENRRQRNRASARKHREKQERAFDALKEKNALLRERLQASRENYEGLREDFGASEATGTTPTI